MIKINDEQFIEGIIGAIGWILFWYYFKNIANYDVKIEGFIAWTFVWWLRKFGINAYLDYKKRNNLEKKIITIF